jgi:hypothetical protein
VDGPLRRLGAKVLVGRERPGNRGPSMNEITTVGLDLAEGDKPADLPVVQFDRACHQHANRVDARRRRAADPAPPAPKR